MDEDELRQKKKQQLARLNANVMKKQIEDNVKVVVNIQEVKSASGIPVAERIVISNFSGSKINTHNNNALKAESKNSRIGLIEDKKSSSFIPKSTIRNDGTGIRPGYKKENITPQTHTTVANPKIITMGKSAPKFESKNINDNLMNEIKEDIHTLSFPTSLYSSSNYYPSGFSNTFKNAPNDPAGKLYDLSNLPLLCSSSYNDEVVFGCADHALYAINITDKSKRIKKLYTKQHGHAEWVSSVSHLLDGRVISAGMDGKLCLWDLDKSKCTDLIGHSASISKVLTDTRYNTAISCGYDKNICLWKFDNNSNTKSMNSVIKRGVKASINPTEKLTAHNDAIVDIAYNYSNLLSVSRDGGLVLWDLGEYTPLNRIKAHQGCITALESIKGSNLFVTAGADGFIKIWDSRYQESFTGSSVLATKVPTHTSNDGSRGSAIACITQLSNHNRGSSDCSYLISCGVDGKVVLLDARQSYRIVETYNHARNGCYAVSSIGDSCAIISDGTGMIYCYDIISNELKYGLGASEKGAVRIINNPNNSNLLVTGNEDGKCLIFEY